MAEVQTETSATCQKKLLLLNDPALQTDDSPLLATAQFVDDNRAPGDWLKAAEVLSQRVVHTDTTTEYRRVRAGEYEGTPFAAELSQLMFLAGEDRVDPPRA